jgi:hypothetical protein
VFSMLKYGVVVLLVTSSTASAETARWERAKVMAVEQVSSPAKTPDSSRTRVSSDKPVFLIMGVERGNVELARLQVGKGSRQLLYSAAKKRSASSRAVTITQASDTLRRVTVNEPLEPGEYVLLMEDSSRAFLFQAR